MYKCDFTLSDDSEVFEGYTDGSLWNGWTSIFLTKGQAKKFFRSTPYDYRFIGRKNKERFIVYMEQEEIFFSSPIPLENGEILRGFAIEGWEFMEVKENEFETSECN